jgi:hypothetical protein
LNTSPDRRFSSTEFEEEMRIELDMEVLRELRPCEALWKSWTPGKIAEWPLPQLGFPIGDESFRHIEAAYPFEFEAAERKIQT